jgi:hypothetical protein
VDSTDLLIALDLLASLPRPTVRLPLAAGLRENRRR